MGLKFSFELKTTWFIVPLFKADSMEIPASDEIRSGVLEEAGSLFWEEPRWRLATLWSIHLRTAGQLIILTRLMWWRWHGIFHSGRDSCWHGQRRHRFFFLLLLLRWCGSWWHIKCMSLCEPDQLLCHNEVSFVRISSCCPPRSECNMRTTPTFDSRYSPLRLWTEMNKKISPVAHHGVRHRGHPPTTKRQHDPLGSEQHGEDEDPEFTIGNLYLFTTRQ